MSASIAWPAKETSMKPLAHASQGGFALTCRPAWDAVARGFLRSGIGSKPVPESDRGLSEKRYCCAGPETPHKCASKLARMARKADG